MGAISLEQLHTALQSVPVHLHEEVLKYIDYLKFKSISEEEVDESVQQEMIARAKRSNEDIKAGRVNSVEEAEARLERRYGS